MDVIEKGMDRIKKGACRVAVILEIRIKKRPETLSLAVFFARFF